MLAASVLANHSYGQSRSSVEPQFDLKKTSETPVIDGLLDEDVWQKAHVITGFFQNFPNDFIPSSRRTEVMLAYDEENLYIAARLYTQGQEPVIQTLERNFNWGLNDNFSVDIDPFGDQQNGFHFSVNAAGAQRDGQISRGSSVDQNWDNRWYAEVRIFEEYWTVEMAIPFKTLRFNNQRRDWNINFSRNDIRANERSSWRPVPRNFGVSTLSFTGKMKWDAHPPSAGRSLVLLPYVSTAGNRIFATQNSYNYTYDMGLDAKLALTSSVNLDITINPDFAQTQADGLQTNLTRFSLFLPEQRQFFLENADLFAQSGFSRIRPFFSRRIGLYQGNQVPIIAGARLSGKVTDNMRIGFLNMQTSADSALDLQTQNFSVAALQYDVFTRSNLSFIFVNRHGRDFNNLLGNDFNRVAGFDFNLASADNIWRGIFFLHGSFSPTKITDVHGQEITRSSFALAHAVWLMYNSEDWVFQWNHEYIERDYNAEVGYVQRTNVTRLEPSLERRIFQDHEFINFHSFRVHWDRYMLLDGPVTDDNYSVRYSLFFLNSSHISIQLDRLFTRLREETDITRTGGVPIPAGTYSNSVGMVSFATDGRAILSGSGAFSYGEFYTGTRVMYRSSMAFRHRPYGVISVGYERNIITMPEPYDSPDLHLLDVTVNASISRSLAFYSRMQVSSQMELFATNSRLRWRFAPMSDLYLVYTDNYGTVGNFEPVSRSLVLKVSYWIAN